MNLGKYSHTTSRDMKFDKEQLKCNSFGSVQISTHSKHQIKYKNRNGDVVAISQWCGDHGLHFAFFPQDNTEHPFAMVVEVDTHGVTRVFNYDNH